MRGGQMMAVRIGSDMAISKRPNAMPKRMKQDDLILYTWDELSYSAKEKAVQEYAESEVISWDWWEYSVEAIDEFLERIGFSVSRRNYRTVGEKLLSEPDFSWSFDRDRHFHWKGSYSYQAGAAKVILADYGPQSEWGKEMIDIAKRLQALQRKHFYGFTASGEFPYFSRWEPEVYYGNRWIDIEQKACRPFEEIFLDISHWAIKQIEEEYEHLTSEEHAVETFQEMDYYFKKDGEIEIWGAMDEELEDCEDCDDEDSDD
jgi:hypothetical protein